MLDAVAVPYPEPTPSRPLPTIRFTYLTQADVDALFDLETVAVAALHDAGLGSIDGNEIGGGTFELFLEPKRGKRAAAIGLVQSLALEKGILPADAAGGKAS